MARHIPPPSKSSGAVKKIGDLPPAVLEVLANIPLPAGVDRKAVLELGINDPVDKNTGETLLALVLKHPKVVKILLDHGANPNVEFFEESLQRPYMTGPVLVLREYANPAFRRSALFRALDLNRESAAVLISRKEVNVNQLGRRSNCKYYQ